MIFNIIYVITVFIAFLLCVSAYCLGLSHGKKIKDGEVPRFDINPVKAVERIADEIQAKQDEIEFKEDLNALVSTKEELLKRIANERMEGRV